MSGWQFKLAKKLVLSKCCLISKTNPMHIACIEGSGMVNIDYPWGGRGAVFLDIFEIPGATPGTMSNN